MLVVTCLMRVCGCGGERCPTRTNQIMVRLDLAEILSPPRSPLTPDNEGHADDVLLSELFA
jgi:hypothetical protein